MKTSVPDTTSQLSLWGEPVADLRFERVPSINDYIRQLGRHAVEGGRFEKVWRTLGHRTAETWLADHGVKLKACRREDGTTGVRAIEPVIPDKIVVLWKIWKSNRQTKDSAFNALTKAIEDGFTDAGLWPGDDDRYMLGRITLFCGVLDKPRVDCEVHRVVHTFDGRISGIMPTVIVTDAARANVGEGESKLKRTTRRRKQ